MASPVGKGLPTNKYNPEDSKVSEKDIKPSIDPNAKAGVVRDSSLHALPSSSEDLKTKDIVVKTHANKDNDYVKELSSLVEKLSSSTKDPTVEELVNLKFLQEKIQSGQGKKLDSLSFWEVPSMLTELLGTSLLSKASKLYSDGFEKLAGTDQNLVKQRLDELNTEKSPEKSIETRQIEGVTFIGHFNSEGRLEGEGQIIYPGAIHKGSFKDGILDGVGEIVFKDYTVRGFFEKGDLRETYALTQHEEVTHREVENFPKEVENAPKSTYKTINRDDGVELHGEFDERERLHGYGKMTFEDGNSYEGNGWEHGKLNGEGTVTTPKGVVKEGIFTNSEFKEKVVETSKTPIEETKEKDTSAYKTITRDDGVELYGEFDEREMLHGYGKMTFEDGTSYEGNGWVNGKLNGEGTVTTPMGVVKEGIFVNSVFKENKP